MINKKKPIGQYVYNMSVNISNFEILTVTSLTVVGLCKKRLRLIAFKLNIL